jgi:hypothetical protein
VSRSDDFRQRDPTKWFVAILVAASAVAALIAMNQCSLRGPHVSAILRHLKRVALMAESALAFVVNAAAELTRLLRF